MITQIKKLIPQKLFKALQPYYHRALNFCAAAYYGFPSEKLHIVGVTGTTGKTTVTYMAAQMLAGAGVKVGYTSTAMFGDGEREWLNDKKMTMLGRFFTQKMLATMIDNGCTVAIVETTSEGIVQERHRYINYDTVIFTGLYPEHIESHGSFENYKNAKLELFRHLEKSHTKNLPASSVLKTIIAHGDDEHAIDFLDFNVAQKILYTKNDVCIDGVSQKVYHFSEATRDGITFTYDGSHIALSLLGSFTATNAAAVAAIGDALGLNRDDVITGLESITNIPGRLEHLAVDQDFDVIVDYAFEPVALAGLYETVAVLQPEKIIHVLGSTGGGRDISRRAELGKIAGEKADVVIVTNEDPYDDEPMEIIKDVAAGAMEKGKEVHHDLYLIEDRGTAIEKALSIAAENDLVLITGKGSEQAIAAADGKLLPWDDRDAVRNFFHKKTANN